MNTLLERESKWQRVLDIVRQTGNIGNRLRLFCPQHVDNSQWTVSQPSEVHAAICSLPCEFRLPCGHACPRLCHLDDAFHQELKCMHAYGRKCVRGLHDCKKKCHELCAPCLAQMEVTLRCQHTATVSCFVDIQTLECVSRCSKIICGRGHQCPFLCGQECPDLCSVPLEITMPGAFPLPLSPFFNCILILFYYHSISSFVAVALSTYFSNLHYLLRFKSASSLCTQANDTMLTRPK